MSSESPDTDRKKLKQPLSVRTSIPNRQQPLFASRRPAVNQQQHPDFFTESLNTSYIPAPSPTKNATRPAWGAKPRQVGENKRTLGTAFKATTDLKDGDKSPSTSRSERRRIQSSRTGQPSARASPKSSVKNPPPGREKTRTPSPSRGRQESIVSPSSSASSPPRGLAEAYQRIEDEELLAGQEGDSDEEPSFSDGNLSFDQIQDMDRMRVQRIRDSESPISRKTSRRASPKKPIEITTSPFVTMDQENTTLDLNQDSSPSLPRTATDHSFNRALAQHAKDEQRVRGALRSDAQPFSKARTKGRAGLTVENLQRKNNTSRSGSSTVGSRSISSRGSDPPLNLPREWGRKGTRGDNRWLNRIDRKSGKFTGDIPKSRQIEDVEPTRAAVPEERRSSEPILDWVAAASEVPLPSVESGSSRPDLVSLSPRGTIPVPNVRRRTSLGQIPEWDMNEDDFTTQSLQISDSPPLRTKSTTTLDQIREREIENLEKSAVTTSRLGELREKRSIDYIRRRSPSVSSDISRDDRQQDKEQSMSRRTSSSTSPLKPNWREKTSIINDQPLIEEDGDPICKPPISVSKLETTGRPASSNGYLQTNTDPKSHSSQRPSHERQDSRDLLRRLARVTSASPSSSSAKLEQTVDPIITPSKSKDAKPSRVDPDPSKVDEGSKKDIKQDNEDLRPLKALPKPSQPQVQTASTPQQSKSNTYLKTPRVTGAWIDTPLPTGRRGPPLPTPENPFDIRDPTSNIDATMTMLGAQSILQNPGSSLESTAPQLPSSTLTNILEKAKTKRRNSHSSHAYAPNDPISNSDSESTLQLNESTIQSLEELIAADPEQDIDIAALLTPPHTSFPPSPSSPSPTSSHPPSQTQTQQESDLQPYTQLSSRLSKLGLSIRHAKKGIASLERFVSSSSTPPLTTAIGDECPEAGEFHDFIWPCERCGCRGSALSTSNENIDRQTFLVSVPRLWVWRKGDKIPKLTWTGLGVLVGGAGLLGEWVVCKFYTPPFTAPSMLNYGIDINNPTLHPPLLLPKLLLSTLLHFFQSILVSPLGSLLTPFYIFAVLVAKTISGVLGWVVGFVVSVLGEGVGREGVGVGMGEAGKADGVFGEWGMESRDMGMGADEFVVS